MSAKFGFTGFLPGSVRHIPGEYERLHTRMTGAVVRFITSHLEQRGVKMRKLNYDPLRDRDVYETAYLLLDIDEKEALEEFEQRMCTATPDDLDEIAIDFWYKLNGWQR